MEVKVALLIAEKGKSDENAFKKFTILFAIDRDGGTINR